MLNLQQLGWTDSRNVRIECAITPDRIFDKIGMATCP
jgi:hypothetical protein